MSTGRPGVLLLGDSLNLGGTEGQFVEVACGLDRSRWDVHVSCLRAVGPLRARLEAAGLSAWSCGPGSFKSPRVVPAVLRLARYLRAHRIRLVHAFDFYSNVLGVAAGRLARMPVVIASQRELGDLRTPGQRRVYRLAAALADYTVVNTEAVAARVRSGRGRARLVIVHNGVDTRRFAPEVTRPRDLTGRVTVGTLANLRREKGLEHLLEAMALVRAHCPEARLMIWGDGPRRADLERLTAGLGLSGDVVFRGATTAPAAALKTLDVFALPSLSEACSNVVLEAMASGLAVVATSVGGTGALVEDEATGLLVPPGDAAALAKAIIRLVEEPALAARLGAGARAAVVADFSLEGMLRQLHTLYERALGLPAPAPAR